LKFPVSTSVYLFIALVALVVSHENQNPLAIPAAITA
jgi:hypothetical protein